MPRSICRGQSWRKRYLRDKFRSRRISRDKDINSSQALELDLKGKIFRVVESILLSSFFGRLLKLFAPFSNNIPKIELSPPPAFDLTPPPTRISRSKDTHTACLFIDKTLQSGITGFILSLNT